MESFEVLLPEGLLRIEPQQNGQYRIMQGETKLGVIQTERDGEELKWGTQDNMDQDFVQKIGEQIKGHDV